jgi:HK97 family phage prohead protease
MKTMLERKDGLFKGDFGPSVDIEIKEVSEQGEFEGYAAIFNSADQGRDIILPGAFRQSLIDTPPERVRCLYQHNPSEVIGKYTEIREDEKGLYCKGRLFQSVQRGRECADLMREKAIEGLSIGYRTNAGGAEVDRERGVRLLKSVSLLEISVVTFPMHPDAGIKLVKQDGTLPTERELEDWLARDAGFSRQDAKAIIAKGYRSLITSERDAGGSGDAALNSAFMEAAERLRKLSTKGDQHV